MIRNIIFDMGNVLIRFDRKTFIQRFFVAEEDARLLEREVFQSVEWACLDRGSLAEPEMVQRVCQRLPEHLHDTAKQLITMWDQPLLPIGGMDRLVEELKKNGYGIYLLSNASVRQHEYWPRVPGSSFFDGTLISADVRLVKPQPEIYQLLLDTFCLKAEECFFIDDSAPNIEAAAYACGMPGMVFHGDAAEVRAALRAAGVNVSA